MIDPIPLTVTEALHRKTFTEVLQYIRAAKLTASEIYEIMDATKVAIAGHLQKEKKKSQTEEVG